MASTRAPLNPLAENSFSAAARIRCRVRRGSRMAPFPESISTEPESSIASNHTDTKTRQVTVKLLSGTLMVQFAVGRDAALRRPRPRSADGNPSTRLGHFFAPLNAARSSQRDDPTARTQTVPLPAGTEATP